METKRPSLTPDAIRERMLRAGRGTTIAAVREAIFPVLEQMKDQLFAELAYLPPDSLLLAKLSGRAQAVEDLLRALSAQLEEGQAALLELQPKH